MRLPALLIATLIYVSSFADTKELWTIMPDSITACSKSDVMSVNDSTDVLTVEVSSTYTIQAVTLSTKENEEKVFCVIKTFSAPEKESELAIYDSAWTLINEKRFSLSDILGEKASTNIGLYFDPLLISALFSDSCRIKVQIADFMLSDDEKKEIAKSIGINYDTENTNSSLQLTRTLKWDGANFVIE